MLGPLLLLAIPLLAAYLWSRVRFSRFKQYGKLPQLPTSFVWGHLKALNEYISSGNPDWHLGLYPSSSPENMICLA